MTNIKDLLFLQSYGYLALSNLHLPFSVASQEYWSRFEDVVIELHKGLSQAFRLKVSFKLPGIPQRWEMSSHLTPCRSQYSPKTWPTIPTWVLFLEYIWLISLNVHWMNGPSSYEPFAKEHCCLIHQKKHKEGSKELRERRFLLMIPKWQLKHSD